MGTLKNQELLLVSGFILPVSKDGMFHKFKSLKAHYLTIGGFLKLQNLIVPEMLL